MKKTTLVSLCLLAPIAVLSGCGQSDIEKQIQPKKEQKEPNKKQEVKETPAKKPGAEPNKDNKENPAGTEVEKKKTDKELMQEKIDSQDKTIISQNEELEYYRTFVKELTTTLSTEKLKEFIDKEWNYKLTISNINFPKNGILEVSEPTFEVTLTEEKVPYSVIPDEKSLEGRLKDGIKGKLEIDKKDKTLQFETAENIEEKNSKITYTFRDLPSKSVVKLKIDKELQKELKLDKQELEIHVQ